MSNTNQNWDRMGRMMEKYQPQVPPELNFEQLQREMRKGSKPLAPSKKGFLAIIAFLSMGCVAGFVWLGLSIGESTSSSGLDSPNMSVITGMSDNIGTSTEKGTSAERYLNDGPADHRETATSLDSKESGVDQEPIGSSEAKGFGEYVSDQPTNPSYPALDFRPKQVEGRTMKATPELTITENRRVGSIDILISQIEALAIPQRILELDSVDLEFPVKKNRKTPWSLSLGHVWHLRNGFDGRSETDEGVFVRLGYLIPISDKFDLRAELGYRDHSWYWTPNDTEWLRYRESITINGPSGGSTTYNFLARYNQFRSWSLGAELTANFNRLTLGAGARYSYIYGEVSFESSPENDPLNPFNDFRPTLLRRHDLSLTTSVRFRMLGRFGIQASGQLGLIDLSPNALWETPKRESSSALELGIFYNF